MYRLLRKLFFLFPAETAHYMAMNSLRTLCRLPFLRKWIAAKFRAPELPAFSESKILAGCRNPVGLAAGFDKNARYLRELECLGFGFVEIGTVTPLPQAGNPKPRLFRLVADGALINRMGFNNEGMEAVAARLKKWREKNPAAGSRMLVGANIGKNKATPNQEAWRDYEKCFSALYAYADYFVVNVSSPNTPGLRELQEKESLRRILTGLQQMASTLCGKEAPKPILLKIAPDITEFQAVEIAKLAREINLGGLVISNTTIRRENLLTTATKLEAIGAGGLSGKPVKEMSTQLIQFMHRQTEGKIPIIGSGGIFTGEDAREKMQAGAGWVQVWTGFIYEGPAIARNICRQLTGKM